MYTTATASCFCVCFLGIEDNIQHNRFLSHVVFQARSWFLKRETMLLDFLATKNQASVWKNAEDIMMIQRSFLIMYDTYNDVV